MITFIAIIVILTLVLLFISFLKQIKMGQELDDLTVEVSETKTIQESAIVLLKGLKTRLDEAGTDPVKLKALRDDLNTSGDALAQAIVENTPAE